MAHLRVITPGFQTTVQDLGRFGRAHLGVSASGAADALSLRLGNLLVGNPESLPALEMTLVGGTFEFEAEAVAAVTGSDFQPALDGVPVPAWTSFRVRADQRLSLRATRSGARSYLCVAGGFDERPVLGSVSTHLGTGLGGHSGRALRAGDLLELGTPPPGAAQLRRVPEHVVCALRKDRIRVTEGPQAALFPAQALRDFNAGPYTVAEESDRMGIRLRGHAIGLEGMPEMVTEGVSLGAIQVPPGGQPIILFVEHQTTGGYPKLANVISADMHCVGQLRPRDLVRFHFVHFDQAVAMLAEQENLIRVEALFDRHA